MRVALVLGGAACVYADAEAALALGPFASVVGANLIGCVWPDPFDAWVSLHGESFGKMLSERSKRSLPDHRAVLAHASVRSGTPRLPSGITGFVDHNFPGQIHGGSSGLFALKVALIDLGFDRAVLCGVPLDAQGHFNDAQPWDEAHHYRIAWREALPSIRDRARSMSGWTAEFLGRPSADWIGEP